MRLFRPVSQVLGWTALEAAEWRLKPAMQELPLLELRTAVACAARGEANRMTGRQRVMRRFRLAKALRAIEVARAQLRQGRRKLAAAEVASAALATAHA